MMIRGSSQEKKVLTNTEVETLLREARSQTMHYLDLDCGSIHRDALGWLYHLEME